MSNKYHFEAVVCGPHINERTFIYHSVTSASKDFGVSQKLIINALNHINLSGHNANRIIATSFAFHDCNVEFNAINIPSPPNHLFETKSYLTSYRMISSYYVKDKNASRNRSEKLYEVEYLDCTEKIAGTSNLLRFLIDSDSSLDYLKTDDVKFDIAASSLRAFLKNKKFAELQDFQKGKFGYHYVTTL